MYLSPQVLIADGEIALIGRPSIRLNSQKVEMRIHGEQNGENDDMPINAKSQEAL